MKNEMIYLITQMLKVDLKNEIKYENSCIKVKLDDKNVKLMLKKI